MTRGASVGGIGILHDIRRSKLLGSALSSLLICSAGCGSAGDGGEKDDVSLEDPLQGGVPSAGDVSVSTDEDTPANVILDGADPAGLALTYVITEQPQKGVLVGTGPNLTYVPDLNANGSDLFRYLVNNGEEDSQPAVVMVEIAPVNDPPIAVLRPPVHTPEDTEIRLLFEVVDPDGDLITIRITSDPTIGTLSGPLPNPVYVPDPDAFGTDYVAFEADDGFTTSFPAQLEIRVDPVNDPPEVNDLDIEVDEDSSRTFTLNAQDADGDALAYEVMVPPSLGELSGAGPEYTYTPSPDLFGDDQAQIAVFDGTATTLVEVGIHIDGVRDRPVGLPVSVSTEEDTPVTFALEGTDVDSNILTFELRGSADHGTVSLVGAQATYVPDADWSGTDRFSFVAVDGAGPSDPVFATLSVQAAPDAPWATGGDFSGPEDQWMSVSVDGGDVDDDPITWLVHRPPASGALFGSGPTWNYAPDLDFFGVDSFEVTATDGDLASPPVTVTIEVTAVSDPPTATNISVSTNEDEAVGITLLAHDPDGDPLSWRILDEPIRGDLSGTEAEQTYQPRADEHGADDFIFEVSDGGEFATATVSITIHPVNDPPTVSDVTLNIIEDQPVEFTVVGQDVDGSEVVDAVFDPISLGSISGSYPSYTFVPTLNAFGSETVEFTVTDGALTSESALLAITVQPANDPPTADDSVIYPTEDQPFEFIVSGADIDGDPLSYVVVDAPEFGDVTGAGPEFTYTPDPDFDGTDQLSFEARDGARSAVGIVDIEMIPSNDPPIVGDVEVSLAEDQTMALTVPVDDVDDTRHTWTVIQAPLFGVITQDPPDLLYVPPRNFNGDVEIRVRATDPSGLSDDGVVSITVEPRNDAPVAYGQTVSVDEDEPSLIMLSGFDADGDLLTYEITSEPTFGSLSGIPPGVIYTPPPDYVGSDSFAFTTTDGEAVSAVGIVEITVMGVNDVPVAHDLVVSLAEDQTTNLTLTGFDAESTPLSFVIDSLPTHGVLAGVAPDLSYMPEHNYAGVDTFEFHVDDDEWSSDVATVTLTMDPRPDPPQVWDAVAQTDEDDVASLTLVSADPDGDVLTLVLVDPPTNGVVDLDAGSYTPNLDFWGTDAFTFAAHDGTEQSIPATVVVTINPINDPPVPTLADLEVDEDDVVAVQLTATDVDNGLLWYDVVTPPAGTLLGTPPFLSYQSPLNFTGTDTLVWTVSDGIEWVEHTTTVTVTGVNDAPIAQDANPWTTEDVPLSVALAATDLDSASLSWQLLTSPSSGELSGTLPNLVYTPDPDTNGVDGFTFRVDDGELWDDGTITITVVPDPDPPLASSATFNTDEDTSIAVPLTASDPDNDTLTWEITSPPELGTLSGVAPNLTYRPDSDAFGTDTFVFEVDDGTLSAWATVTVVVDPVNDAPESTGSTESTDEDNPTDVTFVASDPEGDDLTYVIVDPPTHGNLVGTGDTVTYSPHAHFYGTDSFTWKADDGVDASLTAGVVITVNPVNDPPVPQPVEVTTVEDQAVSIPLNATDVEGDAVTMAFGAPTHGTLIAGDGSWTYTPTPDFVGDDSFTYTAHDGTDPSIESALVTIHVQAAPDRPRATPVAPVVVDEDDVVLITLSGTDPDGGTVTPSISATTTHGALVSMGGGTWSYAPNLNYHGIDAFSFIVSDESQSSDPMPVSITVTAVNDPPVASDTSGTLDEDEPHTLALIGSDPDNDALEWEITSDAENGTTYLNNSWLTYTPSLDWSGTETVEVTASDGEYLATAWVTFVVEPIDDPPTPVADNYATVGHVKLLVKAGGPNAGGVLENDTDVDGDDLSTVPEALTSALGGAVDVTEDGGFSYSPPAAARYTIDTFEVQVTDGNTVVSSTVSIVLADQVVWFVDNAFAGTGLGTSEAPFTDLGAAQGASEPSDIIHVATGIGDYGAIDLQDGQHLIGAGVDLAVGSETLVQASGAPVLRGVTGTTIQAGSDNVIAGLEVKAGSIYHQSGGDFTLSQVSITDVLGHAMVLVGSGAVTLSEVDIASPTMNGVYAVGVDSLTAVDVTVTSPGANGFELDSVDTVSMNSPITITSPGVNGVLVVGPCTQITSSASIGDINGGSGWRQVIGGTDSCSATLSAAKMLFGTGAGVSLEVGDDASLRFAGSLLGVYGLDSGGVGALSTGNGTLILEVADSDLGASDARMAGQAIRVSVQDTGIAHVTVLSSDLEWCDHADPLEIDVDVTSADAGAWMDIEDNAVGNGITIGSKGLDDLRVASPLALQGMVFVGSDGGAFGALGNTTRTGPPSVRVTGTVSLIPASQVLVP